MSNSIFSPWEYEQEECSDGYQFSVYDVNGTKLTTEYIAKNKAHLISAAPEMLAALKMAHNLTALNKGSKMTIHELNTIEAISAAIAKATGEAI